MAWCPTPLLLVFAFCFVSFGSWGWGGPAGTRLHVCFLPQHCAAVQHALPLPHFGIGFGGDRGIVLPTTARPSLLVHPADFGLLPSLRGAPANGTPEHSVHTLHRHRVPSSTTLSSAGGADGSGALAMENSIGSMGGGGGAASPAPAPHTYVSEFGSLPPRDAGSNLHLNRILLTHAPYMTKLESLASSATR